MNKRLKIIATGGIALLCLCQLPVQAIVLDRLLNDTNTPVNVRASQPQTAADKALNGEAQPNVLLILADDLGIMDTQVYGAHQYATPNINTLANAGVRFSQAYTNAGNCAPSRASLMTGLTPAEHGILTVGSSARGKPALMKLTPPKNRTELDPAIPTLADLFKLRGYHTAIIGKWHLGEQPLTAYGFDEALAASGLGHAPSHFFPYGADKRALPGLEQPKQQDEYLADRLTAEAISYMQQQQSPFFLYLPFYAVHTPIEASENDIRPHLPAMQAGKIKNATYAAMVSNLDTNVGKLLSALQTMGKADNTLVIFASDNGGFEPVTSSLPYRGAKSTLFEGGIRTPLLMRWPGVIPPDTQNQTPVQLSELFATVSHLLGLEQTQDNLLTLAVRQQQKSDKTLFWHAPVYMTQNAAINSDPAYSYWKHTPASAIRDGHYKLIHNDETDTNLLFDLHADPGEQQDIAASRSDIERQLYQKLRAWQRMVNAPMADQANPAYHPTSPAPQQVYQSLP
ncbi:sulfatase [Shewanella sp. GXUN23E]|uniref:sulfatase n=1 Tax=Shewanella sp. GXUN23E TaxID=3422498 RepID=UPI003D7D9A18